MNTNQIHSTLNYDMFKGVTNRDVKDWKHLGDIKKDGLFVPIVINEKMQLIDGQHRLAACKHLGIPVDYIIRPNVKAQDVMKINMSQKKWKSEDFLEAYCKDGHQEYLRLKAFMKSYPGLSLLAAKSLLTFTNNNIIQAFREGEFKVTHLELALEQATYLWFYATYYDKPFVKSTRFVRGYQKVYKLLYLDGNVSDLNKAMEDNSRRVVKCNSIAECAEMLVELYNYRRRKNKLKLDD